MTGRAQGLGDGVVDLRSDTVTQPTAEMRRAIADAAVGDDGYGEDPTINELEATVAELVGKPAAVYVPSGVMANQIAVRVLAQPGDLVVAGAHYHVCSFEAGAAARNSGVQFALLDDATGVLDPAAVAGVIDAEADHQPRVGLVCVEQTHMYSGGVPWTTSEIDAVCAASAGRPVHLDGARLANAVVATGAPAAAHAARATTVMFSLSKGLCAPVGSVLAGPTDVIAAARIERKRLGGAMRQAGFLAAAGLVGLRTMMERLADDHDRARRLAAVVAARFPESKYDPATCRTNIVAFDHPRAREIITRLAERGVLGGTVAPHRARFVTHAGVDDDGIARASREIQAFEL